MISALDTSLELWIFLLWTSFASGMRHFNSILVWIFLFHVFYKMLTRERFFKRTPLDLPIVIFTVSVFLPSIIQIGFYDTWRAGKVIIYCIILYYVLVDCVCRRPGLVKRIAIFCVIIGVILGIYSLFQTVVDLKFTELKIEHLDRARALFSNENLLGFFLVGVIPLALYLFNKTTSVSGKGVSFLALVSMLAGLVVTGNRSSWLALIIVLIILFASGMRKGAQYTFLAAITIVVFFAFVFSFHLSSERISHTAVWNVMQDRWTTWERTMSIIKEEPVLGYGMNTFWNVYNEYIKKHNLSPDVDRFPHMFILEIWQVSGIFALLSFLYFLCRYVRTCWPYANKSETINTLICSSLALFISASVNVGLMSRYYNFLFWFFSGLLMGSIELFKQREPHIIH